MRHVLREEESKGKRTGETPERSTCRNGNTKFWRCSHPARDGAHGLLNPYIFSTRARTQCASMQTAKRVIEIPGERKKKDGSIVRCARG